MSAQAELPPVEPQYLGTRFDEIADALEELRDAYTTRHVTDRPGRVGDPLSRHFAVLIGELRDEAAAEFSDPSAK